MIAKMMAGAALAMLPLSAAQAAQPPAAAPAAPAPAPATGAPVDLARLAAARRLVSQMWPEGAFEGAMAAGMAQGFAAPSAVDAEAAAQDPNHAERMRLTEQAMLHELRDLLGAILPDLREVMARYYARRVGAAELDLAASFYATPGGRRFASGAFEAAARPGAIQAFEAVDAEVGIQIAAEMADLPQQIAAATAHLPPLPGMNEALAAGAPPIATTEVGEEAAESDADESHVDGDTEEPVAAPAAPAGPAAASLPPVDPARLAAARRAVDLVWPAEALGQPIALQPLADLLAETQIGAFGIPVPADSGLRAEQTIGETIAAFDPHYRERLRIALDLLAPKVGRMLVVVEPHYRAITAEIYAREFSAAELDEVARFYATPAGRSLARESYAGLSDPEMMRDLLRLVPRVVAAVQPAWARVQAATAHLPPVPAPPVPEEDEEAHDHDEI
jgi:hypothetical protein